MTQGNLNDMKQSDRPLWIFPVTYQPQLTCLRKSEDQLESMQQLFHQFATENVQMRE